jgi:5'-deoxynucleotidase YfbR-like HD superfamily hydrolase
MLSGRRLDLLDPSPLDVELADIAHGLARVARWNGQTTGSHAFSVAQHTLIVESIAGVLSPRMSPAERLATLLHDAPEYVIGDMISPFKALIGGDYREVESRLLTAIHRRFGLAVPLPERAIALIKVADRVAAYYEATRLAGFSEKEALRFFGQPRGVDPAEIELTPWPAARAEKRFHKRFEAVLALVQAQPPSAPTKPARRGDHARRVP